MEGCNCTERKRIGQMLYGKDFMVVLHNKFCATYHSISVTSTSRGIKNLARKITQTSIFHIFGNFHIGLKLLVIIIEYGLPTRE